MREAEDVYLQGDCENISEKQDDSIMPGVQGYPTRMWKQDEWDETRQKLCVDKLPEEHCVQN